MDMTAALRDGFADRHRVVIIDLHGMEDDDAASLPLWLAPRRAANVLRYHLPLCVTMIEARTAADPSTV
jgi:hypothetical protein